MASTDTARGNRLPPKSVHKWESANHLSYVVACLGALKHTGVYWLDTPDNS